MAMKLSVVLLLVIFLTGCQTATTRPNESTGRSESPVGHLFFSGGDGSSIEQAVVIHGATEGTGIRAEYDWIEVQHPHFKRKGQALLNEHGKIYDEVNVETAEGRPKSYYFDITEFFGKFK
jgi:hypothetical protein